MKFENNYLVNIRKMNTKWERRYFLEIKSETTVRCSF